MALTGGSDGNPTVSIATSDTKALAAPRLLGSTGPPPAPIRRLPLSTASPRAAPGPTAPGLLFAGVPAPAERRDGNGWWARVSRRGRPCQPHFSSIPNLGLVVHLFLENRPQFLQVARQPLVVALGLATGRSFARGGESEGPRRGLDPRFRLALGRTAPQPRG